MAMLLLKDVFQRTWKGLVHAECDEFWPGAIKKVRSMEGKCILLAEVYWNREKEILDYGFDYAYDKILYDLMVRGDIKGLQGHITAPIGHQEKMIRFLENHDEPRALAFLGPERITSAMVIHATLPGMRFWQHGQFEGSKLHVPVQLRRAPDEEEDRALKIFCAELLKETNDRVFHDGDWKVCPTHGWPDNDSHRNLLAWCWTLNEDRRLIVVNFSPKPVEGYVEFPESLFPEGNEIICRDPLKNDLFIRSAVDVRKEGLCVFLDRYDFHFFKIGKE
jgi:hypothetical protein